MGVSSHNCEKQDCVHTATGGLLNLVPSYGVALYWVSISNSTEVSSRWIFPGVGSSNERLHESQRIVIPNLTLINPRFCIHFCNCKVRKLGPPELQRVPRCYWCRAHEQQSAAPPSGHDESHPALPGEGGEVNHPPQPKKRRGRRPPSSKSLASFLLRNKLQHSRIHSFSFPSHTHRHPG